jgi:hypothetical protein
MREAGDHDKISVARPSSQGLTLNLRYGSKRLKTREVSERKQVGDAESMVNEGRNASGVSGLFGREGEV